MANYLSNEMFDDDRFRREGDLPRLDGSVTIMLTER